MSDVNLDFTIANNAITITPSVTDITISPTEVDLNILTGGLGVPGGSINEVQYNGGSSLAGASGLTYVAGVTNITTATVGNMTVSGNIITSNITAQNTTTLKDVSVTGTTNLNNLSNITITGGSNNYVLTTNGSGVLTWKDSTINANYANFAGAAFSVDGPNVTNTVANANYAAFAGAVVTSSQPNITLLGTQSNFTSNGTVDFTGASNVSLGYSSNIHILGGINGYYLQTDGAGNITWAAGTGGGGNGSPGGANTQIQFNDAGIFGGNAGFTFDKTSGNVAMPANLTVAGNISGNISYANFANYAGNVTIANQPNITQVGSLLNLTVTGTSKIQQASEKVTVAGTGSSGIINYDLLTSAIILNNQTSTANFGINFRGNSTTTFNSIIDNNTSMTCTYINTNGTTPYVLNGISIDGVTQTPIWFGGNAPTIGTPSGKDVYTFNIMKTASSTYTVFASRGSAA